MSFNIDVDKLKYNYTIIDIILQCDIYMFIKTGSTYSIKVMTSNDR